MSPIEQQSPDGDAAVTPFDPVSDAARMEAPAHLCNQRFETRGEIIVSLHAHAASQGYAMVTQRTKKNTTGLQKIWMVCDRNYAHQSKAKKRRTATRGTGCSM